jgi:hypothetical protein
MNGTWGTHTGSSYTMVHFFSDGEEQALCGRTKRNIVHRPFICLDRWNPTNKGTCPTCKAIMKWKTLEEEGVKK